MRRDELERELNYYRREYNDLGARVLRLQEEQSKAFREARRSRTVAKLIREAYRLVDRASVTDEIGTLMLEIIVDNTMCDRTAILRQLPNDGHFAVTHVLGFGQEPAPGVRLAAAGQSGGAPGMRPPDSCAPWQPWQPWPT